MIYSEDFDQLPWHDAELFAINIDRSDPGNNDSVILFVQWPDGIKNQMIFHECYGLHLEMNFGIIAIETILYAQCFNESEQLSEIKETWKKIEVDLEDLFCYQIVTNSTNSNILIFAKTYEVIPLDESGKEE